MPEFGGQIETVEQDIGTKPSDRVRYWKAEIALAEKHLKDWKKRGREVVETYRDEAKGRPNRFNILWSNTETMKPALYGQVPTPDVRRRITDSRNPDPAGRAAAIVLERGLSHSIDDGRFDQSMQNAVEDYLLPGRAVVRVKYIPTMAMGEAPEIPLDRIEREFDDFGAFKGARFFAGDEEFEPDKVQGLDRIEGLFVENERRVDMGGIPEEHRPFVLGEPVEEVVNEQVRYVYVFWRDYLESPGRDWEAVRWVAYRSRLSREDLRDQFGKELGDKITLDWTPTGLEESDDEIVEMFKKATVWEIWNKAERKVEVIAMGYDDGLLDEWDDPLKLEGFFPQPQPLDFVTTNDTSVPIPLYTLYQSQAQELEKITARIDKLIGQLKVRGVYDKAAEALAGVLDLNDGQLIGVDNFAEMVGAGKRSGASVLDSVIGLMPIEKIAQVLTGLYKQRDVIRQTIFEITGLSDIIRGQTDPNETKGAQVLKARFGQLRHERPQKNVQRFARDLLRLGAEIMAEHFGQATLEDVSGLELPSAEEREARQQQGALAAAAPQGQPAPGQPGPQQPGQQPTQGQPVPQEPEDATPEATWEEVMALLQDDGARGFRIDIETDSTVLVDVEQEQRNRIEFLTAVTGFAEKWLPAMQQGAVTPALFKAMLVFAVRGFKVGREIEEELEGLGVPQAPQNEGADETRLKAQVEQIKAKIAAAELQLKGKIHTDEMALKREAMLAEDAREREKNERDAEIRREEIAAKANAAVLDRLKHQETIGAKREETATRQQTEREKMADARVAREAASSQNAEAQAPQTVVIDAQSAEGQKALRTLQDTRHDETGEQVAANVAELAEATRAIAGDIAQLAAGTVELTTALAALKQHIDAPKEIVRDKGGKAVGIRVAGEKRMAAIVRDKNDRIVGATAPGTKTIQ